MTSKTYPRQAWTARTIGGRMARLFRPSTVRLLSVPGRTTGRWRSVPIVALPDPADHPTFRITGADQRSEGPTK
jgi:hypothetical protein